MTLHGTTRRRSWPSLFDTDVRKVSERDCEQWLGAYQKTYAATVVNNSIGVLRAVFQEAIGAGVRFNNPAAALKRVKVRAKRLQLPSRSEFLVFVQTIRTAGARQSKDCANLVRFLAYSGVRIGEAENVAWADVNFARRELHVRGDKETATKNGETRFIPMIPGLSTICLSPKVPTVRAPRTCRLYTQKSPRPGGASGFKIESSIGLGGNS